MSDPKVDAGAPQEDAGTCPHETGRYWRATLICDRCGKRVGDHYVHGLDGLRWNLRGIALGRPAWKGDQDVAVPAQPQDRTEPAPQEKKSCVIGRHCRRHGFVHGAEAEELRSRVEAILAQVDHEGDDAADALDRALRIALYEIDARDSLAYLEVAVPARAHQDEKEHEEKDDQSRVDGVPGVGQGDLPRKSQRGEQ